MSEGEHSPDDGYWKEGKETNYLAEVDLGDKPLKLNVIMWVIAKDEEEARKFIKDEYPASTIISIKGPMDEIIDYLGNDLWRLRDMVVADKKPAKKNPWSSYD